MSKQENANVDYHNGPSKNTEKGTERVTTPDVVPTIDNQIFRRDDIHRIVTEVIKKAIPVIVKAVREEDSKGKEQHNQLKRKGKEGVSLERVNENETIKEQNIQQSGTPKIFRIIKTEDAAGLQEGPSRKNDMNQVKKRKFEFKRKGYGKGNCKICTKRHKGICIFDTSQRTCEWCNKIGHTAEYCWKKMICTFCYNIGHDETICRKKAIVCYNCGEKGHYWKGCLKRKNVTVDASGHVERKY